MAGVLEVLAYALEANQNQMVAEVRQVVLQARLPVDVRQINLAAYRQVMPHAWKAGFGRMGQQSLKTVTGILVAELGIGYAACRVSPYACIGVIIVGILATDKLITFSLEKKLTNTCQQIINTARRTVIHDVSNGLQPKIKRDLDTILATNIQTTRRLIVQR